MIESEKEKAGPGPSDMTVVHIALSMAIGVCCLRYSNDGTTHLRLIVRSLSKISYFYREESGAVLD